jgi:hypothetical protein
MTRRWATRRWWCFPTARSRRSAGPIVRAGALPDGTPVNALRLIFPRRVDALAMHARAIAAGFEMTTYGDGGQLWRVQPPPP